MISFSKCTYIIYTHVCKKNMFHTFQRAEPNPGQKKGWPSPPSKKKSVALQKFKARAHKLIADERNKKDLAQKKEDLSKKWHDLDESLYKKRVEIDKHFRKLQGKLHEFKTEYETTKNDKNEDQKKPFDTFFEKAKVLGCRKKKDNEDVEEYNEDLEICMDKKPYNPQIKTSILEDIFLKNLQKLLKTKAATPEMKNKIKPVMDNLNNIKPVLIQLIKLEEKRIENFKKIEKLKKELKTLKDKKIK